MTSSAASPTPTHDPTALVTLTEVGYQVANKVILQDINLSLCAGDIVTLVGPNGAGKSTLVKIILQLLAPTVGQRVGQSGLRLGYVPQRLHIEPFVPMQGLRFLKLSPFATAANIESVAQQLELERVLAANVHTLSGGERQRLMLARALLGSPDLLVLDEPTQGLDLVGQKRFYQKIRTIRKQTGCGILLVSHDLHVVMAGTDQVICLQRHICCSGPPATVCNNPEFLKLFDLSAGSDLALYAHRHDHDHTPDGGVARD